MDSSDSENEVKVTIGPVNMQSLWDNLPDCDDQLDLDDFVGEYKNDDNRLEVTCGLIKSRMDHIKRQRGNIMKNSTALQLKVPGSQDTVPIIYDDSGSFCFQFAPNWIMHTSKANMDDYTKMMTKLNESFIDCMMPKSEVFLLMVPEESQILGERFHTVKSVGALSSISIAHCESRGSKLIVHDLYVCHVLYEFISAKKFYCVPIFKNFIELINVNYNTIYIDYSSLAEKDKIRNVLQNSNLLPVSILFKRDVKIYELKNILKTQLENSGCPLQINEKGKNHYFGDPCPYCSSISALRYIGTNIKILKSNLNANFEKLTRADQIECKLISYINCDDIKIFMYLKSQLYDFKGDQREIKRMKGEIRTFCKNDNKIWALESKCPKDHQNNDFSLPLVFGKRKIEYLEKSDNLKNGDVLDLDCPEEGEILSEINISTSSRNPYLKHTKRVKFNRLLN